MNPLTTIYHNEVPSFLLPFLEAREMTRLKDVGMHCGMEYTSFPFYKDLKEYSRFTHCLNTALITYHFSKDTRQSLASLFHDIATPCFAHVIDFLKKDYVRQEATEEETTRIIENSNKIQENLKRLGLCTFDVNDYHRYPICDNDSPKLSSDRLEYTLSNLYHYGFASIEELREIYQDIEVSLNEDKEEELCFQSLSLAKKFALLTLKNSHVYVTDEDRYGMEYLSRVLKKAIDRNVISMNDLYLTEKELIDKLLQDEETKKDFLSFRNLRHVTKEAFPTSPYSFKIPSKKRYIDPYVMNQGRVSHLNEEVRLKIQEFLDDSFDYFVKCI